MKKTKAEIAEIKKQQKQILEKWMDDRDYFYKCLEEFEAKYKFIPENHKRDIRTMNAYQEYKRFKGWRNIPGMKTIINKSAKVATENIINESGKKPISSEQRLKELTKKTEEIYKEVEKAEKVLNKK